jgi:hypothetical protein
VEKCFPEARVKAPRSEGFRADGTPAATTPLGSDRNGQPFKENYEYSSVVGMLLYLTHSRPEIQFAVHQVARFCHSPKDSHAKAIHRICRYLKGTKNKGMQFVSDTDDLQLDCYVDADFAGLFNVENALDPICSKSRTGYVIFLGKCPIAWVSRLQHETALSTTESEYIALSQAMRELIPMRNLVTKVAEILGSPELAVKMHSTVYEDNNGCISQAKKEKFTPRNKHYATKLHFFKSHIGTGKGQINLEHIDTEDQIADIFTKGLAAELFTKLRKLLMGW